MLSLPAPKAVGSRVCLVVLVYVQDRAGVLEEVEHFASEMPAEHAYGLALRRLLAVSSVLLDFVEVAHDLEHSTGAGISLGVEASGEGRDGGRVWRKSLQNASDLLIHGQSRLPALHDPSVCDRDWEWFGAAAATDQGSVGFDPEGGGHLGSRRGATGKREVGVLADGHARRLTAELSAWPGVSSPHERDRRT